MTDYLTLIVGPAVVAAAVSGVVSVVGLLITTKSNLSINQAKIDFDKMQSERKIQADIELAERKLQIDIEIAHRKRKIEISQDILEKFYEAVETIRYARVPAGFTYEGSSRLKEEWEREGDTAVLNLYFQIADRLNRRKDIFAQISAQRARASAVFGEEANLVFNDLFELRGEIILGVDMLIRMYRDREKRELVDQYYEWQLIVGWSGSSDDAVNKRLNEILKRIERICYII